MAENIDIELSLKVDWLAFTIPSSSDKNFKILKFLKYDLKEFDEISGKNFLNCGLSYGGGAVRIFFNREDLPTQLGSSDIHNYVFSGVGCTDLSQKWQNNWGGLFAYLASLNVNFKRIDLAIDDFSNPPKVTFPMVLNKLEKKEFVSSKRKWNHLLDRSTTGEITGETIYFGVRKSSSVGHTLLRIYDKRKELIDKGEESQLPIAVLKSRSWIRWELEITKQKASSAIDLLLQCGSLSKVAFGILRDIVDFKTPTKNSYGEVYTSKQRWKTVRWWDNFLQQTKKAKLIEPEKIYDLGSALRWVKVAVVPTLQVLDDIFSENLNFDFYRLLKHLPDAPVSKKQLKLIQEAKMMNKYDLANYLYKFLNGENDA